MEKRVLGKYIAMLHRREQKYMIQKMKEFGLGYSDYNFIMYLAAHEGSSQKEMCEGMGVDEALAVRVMKKLEGKGLITRKRTEEKNRKYSIYLTSKSKEMLPEIRGLLTQWWEGVLEDIDEEEEKLLLKNIEKMAEKSERVLKE